MMRLPRRKQTGREPGKMMCETRSDRRDSREWDGTDMEGLYRR
jgi:hypothetical protein